jgi:hypothetical protein
MDKNMKYDAMNNATWKLVWAQEACYGSLVTENLRIRIDVVRNMMWERYIEAARKL